MNVKTKEIIDVYHQFADSKTEEDSHCRRFIHGLNRSFLFKHGFDNETELLADFKLWLKYKTPKFIFANNPRKEMNALSLNIRDIHLPNWLERVNGAYHKVAVRFKELNIPLLCYSCYREAHSSYENVSVSSCKNESLKVKAQHGHRCSLYDTYELYLFYIMSL